MLGKRLDFDCLSNIKNDARTRFPKQVGLYTTLQYNTKRIYTTCIAVYTYTMRFYSNNLGHTCTTLINHKKLPAKTTVAYPMRHFNQEFFLLFRKFMQILLRYICIYL